MTKRKPLIKRPARANAAGRELLAAVREAHRAITSGDFKSLTVQRVEVPEPGKYDARE